MNVPLCCFIKVSYIYIEREIHFTRHEHLQIAFAALVNMEAVPEVLPPPAPGHHDSKQYPELDCQQVLSGVSAESPPAPSHEKWTDKDFEPACPDQEKEGAAVEKDDVNLDPPAGEKEPEEGDWPSENDDDGDEDEVEPQCLHMSTPSCFGLGEAIAEYLGMDFAKLSDFVPLLRVPFGKDDAMKKLAWSKLCSAERSGVWAESSPGYVEQLIADAQELRKQHENLVRRRMDFAAYCDPEELTEMSGEAKWSKLGVFYKKHRKDFAASEAQEAHRKFDTETTGQFIYANIP